MTGFFDANVRPDLRTLNVKGLRALLREDEAGVARMLGVDVPELRVMLKRSYREVVHRLWALASPKDVRGQG